MTKRPTTSPTAESDRIRQSHSALARRTRPRRQPREALDKIGKVSPAPSNRCVYQGEPRQERLCTLDRRSIRWPREKINEPEDAE